MIRMLAALVVLSALGACATFSTTPEAANARVRQLCYVNREPEWIQIPEPANAQAYRDAWTRGAAAHAPFGRAYAPPRWPEDEFWFRKASGEMRLCTGNPCYREERCSAGSTADFTESADGIAASNYQEPVCLT